MTLGLSLKVMPGETRALWLLLASVASLAAGAAGGAGCERGRSWWDRSRGACVPCTRCEPQRLAVKVPCEPHRDTICQSINEIHIYPFNVPNNNSNDTFSDDEYYIEYTDYGESDDVIEEKWDVQTAILALAVCGCVLFFMVVLYLTFHHSKQWRVLKKALKADVQDLTAKLKLMEAGETTAEPIVPTDHHIYCNIHVAKEVILGPASNKKELGNVYTQEKLPN